MPIGYHGAGRRTVAATTKRRNDTMKRRDFLKACLAGTGAVAGIGMVGSLGAPARAAARARREGKGEAVLKLGAQESRLPGESLQEKVDNLRRYGGTGLELHAWGFPDRIREIKQVLRGTEVKVSAICAATGPFIVPDEAARRKAIDWARTLLEVAAELDAAGVVMVPAFNSAEGQLAGRPARDLLLDVLKEIGGHGEKVGSRVLLEPLNRGEAFFLRQLADAASICRDASSPGVAMMGDFYHMNFEETSDMGAFISAGGYLRHVHLGSIKRNLPGQDERSFVDGMRGLKLIGYRDWLSLECGVIGDPKIEIPKSFRFLEQQWKEARA